MAGSMRQRGKGTWELCVYVGLDADTGRRRYATARCAAPAGKPSVP
jgi:hypothetical protein